MKKVVIIKVMGILVIVLISVMILYFRSTDKITTTDNNKAASVETTEGDKTKVYSILNVPMEDNNMIWCGTFQLAWNELRDNIIKEDIKLEGESKVSPQLNKKAFTKEYLNEKDYIAMAGYNKDSIVEKINAALQDKFHEGGKWKVESELKNPDDILAYSFLKKNIEFRYAFEEIKDGLIFNGSKVKAFGIADTEEGEIRGNLAAQVWLLNYKNEDNFTVSLKGKNEDDEIILAKIPESDTLENTLNYALTNSNEAIALDGRDIIKIPILTFDIEKHFTELENKSLKNKGFENYSIMSALQRIEFSLTEKGAELKSKAEIGIAGAMPDISEPKKLIFDKPFLLYMKEKGDKNPYFAIWVDNSEIMVKQ